MFRLCILFIYLEIQNYLIIGENKNTYCQNSNQCLTVTPILKVIG